MGFLDSPTSPVGSEIEKRPPECITEPSQSADTEFEDLLDFVSSEAFELPSVWVHYSFLVLTLTISPLLRTELCALCVGLVPSAAHRGTRLNSPRWGQSCWIGPLRAAALRPAWLCDTTLDSACLGSIN